MALIIGGGLTAPLALPILPLEMSDKIIRHAFGFVIDDPAMLDGDFHQEYGWREQAAVVAKVYKSLSSQEQNEAIVLTKNYNQASAVNFFGAAWACPRHSAGI